MLRSIKELEGYAIGATDGRIGHVKDFYFDDHAWVVRYLVVDAGAWLASRKVLISPIAIGRTEWTERLLQVSITRQQVKDSPAIDTERPVSRQHEMAYASYYGYPYYWGGAGDWGGGMYPNLMLPGYGGFGSERAARSESDEAYARADAARSQVEDPRLRSAQEVTKYNVHASDGDLGHVDDLLVDDETWAIRYLVVNTSNWWLGHQVLVSSRWIDEVSWSASKVSVTLPRQAIKDAPAYDPAVPVDRAWETRLHEHLGRSGYWAEADRRETENIRA